MAGPAIDRIDVPERTACRCGSAMAREIDRDADLEGFFIIWSCTRPGCKRARYDHYMPEEGIVETEWMDE